MLAPLVALVNRAPAHLGEAALERAARALQTQVDRDAGPVWGIRARVVAAPDRRAPRGCWPIYVVRQPQAGLGVHVDHHGHPFSEVRADGGWTLAASHALLEMLADPSGTRFKEGPAIEPGAAPRRVRYLVEICDPCERHDYTIDGVLVSDFVTPDYYRSEATAGTAFDFLRRLGRPLQVSRGGYLSWLDPADGRWHQRRPDGRFVTSGGRIHPDGGSPRDDRDRAFGDTDERHDLSAIRGAPA